MAEWDWKANDSFKNCSYCGQIVAHGMGWTSVGMCSIHQQIFEEDIKSGFKRNRLREIMLARGQTTESNLATQ